MNVRTLTQLACTVLLALPVLHGCGAPKAPPERPAQVGEKTYRQVLEDRFTVDFKVETRLSGIDGKSCYSFVSGTLSNDSSGTLSQRSGLQFLFYHGGELLFRDLTYPRMNVPPGSRVQFELFQSPLHLKQCPSYDKIEVVLKKVVLPAP